MKSLVVVAAVLAIALAGPAPAPAPAPGATPNSDQEGQASEAVSKRGAARLSPVSGNSITDNPVSNAPLAQQVSQLQLQAPPAQQQVPLYAPHPYSFVQPQPLFHYQPMPMLHSKYHVPGKPQVLQYVQPYFQVPQYQTPLMYIIPQPQPQPQAPQTHQAPQASQQTHQSGSQSGNQAGGQPEQAAPQQPHYVMVLSAPPSPLAPAASGFQYFNHPQLTLPTQPLYTFYAGQQPQLHQPQLHQPQLHQPQLYQPHQHQPQLHHPQLHQQPSRFYPEQQQLIYQSQQPEGPASQNEGPPQFVQKQQNQHQQHQQQGPVGLEAPAPPTPASLVGSYGARVQSQPQHTYKTIIKA